MENETGSCVAKNNQGVKGQKMRDAVGKKV